MESISTRVSFSNNGLHKSRSSLCKNAPREIIGPQFNRQFLKFLRCFNGISGFRGSYSQNCFDQFQRNGLDLPLLPGLGYSSEIGGSNESAVFNHR